MYSPMDTWGFPCEFPHSEIFGSLAMCAYPKLIAAYHVLHRLLMPRHSPCALCSLTYCHDISFKTKLQRIFLGYVVLTYLYNYVQFSKNNVVGLNGLEPSTSRLSGVRSNHLSYRPTYGGGKEIRTPDPLRARQVLSQLSYTPIFNRCSHNAYYFIKKLFRCQYFL